MTQNVIASRGTGSLAPSWTARLKLRELALIPIIVIAMIIGGLVNDSFFSADNILNILQQSSELSILVIAQTLILICGKFDLSLESVVGIAPMFAAWLMVADQTEGGSGIGLNGVLGIVVTLFVGALVGFINGLLVVKLRLNAFIATLAMLILLRGTTVGMTNGRSLFDLPPVYIAIGSMRWLGIPASIWIAGVLFIMFGIFTRYHRLGRALYAIGGNAEAARIAGISVERVTWGVFILGGLLASLAGLLLTGRLASVVASQGQNMIFYVFAAAVIGGVGLNGGQGRLFGALTGVLLLGVIQNVLTLAQIPAFWIDAAYGGIILLSLIIARFSGEAPAR